MSRFAALITILTVLPALTAEAPDPPTTTLKGHKGTLSCLAFSRDGKHLASGAKDGIVIVWDFAARKPLATIPGHKDMIVAVAFSPDGKAVAATSHDAEVRLYDAATGKAAGTLAGHTKGVRGVAMRFDPRRPRAYRAQHLPMRPVSCSTGSARRRSRRVRPVLTAGGAMDGAVGWYLFAGGLLVVMALAGTLLGRLPLSAAMLYLAAGYAVGPAGAGLLDLDPLRDAPILERVTEVAVLVCLFAAGLKLRARPAVGRWLAPVRLATASMVVTIGLVALAGVYLLGLPVGAAIMLGAILAPTDPVLAADVQVADPFDRDRVRFALTGEAGLNDGTAFPFVLLGLGLLGLHDLGTNGLRWAAVDVAWAVAAGLAAGAALGTAVGALVLFLRRHHREAAGLDEFLALGLIALAYAAAQLLHASGFLAVFAAGYALRRVEARATGDRPPEEVQALAVGGPAEELAVHPEKAPAFLAHAVLHFTEQSGRVLEVAAVVALGSMLSAAVVTGDAAVLVAVLLVVARPVAVWIGLIGSGVAGLQGRLVAWFGVRGVGSLYYLAFAATHGFAGPDADRVARLVLATVAASVVAHGVSVTPLMALYARTRRKAGPGSREPTKLIEGAP